MQVYSVVLIMAMATWHIDSQSAQTYSETVCVPLLSTIPEDTTNRRK